MIGPPTDQSPSQSPARGIHPELGPARKKTSAPGGIRTPNPQIRSSGRRCCAVISRVAVSIFRPLCFTVSGHVRPRGCQNGCHLPRASRRPSPRWITRNPRRMVRSQDRGADSEPGKRRGFGTEVGASYAPTPHRLTSAAFRKRIRGISNDWRLLCEVFGIGHWGSCLSWP